MRNHPLAVLLDIEGTTSSLSYVHDSMFPFVRRRLAEFLRDHWGQASLQATLDLMAVDLGRATAQDWLGTGTAAQQQGQVAQQVMAWMDQDLKATGLKQLQGQIWEAGFEAGDLVAHVWPDVPPALQLWAAAGVPIRIYSSGSIAAQKLFFGHSEAGNLLPLFGGHYDTTIGGKKSATSYRAIAEDWGLPAGQILFVSDVVEELEAAAAAGMRVLLSLRPGNLPQSRQFACLQVEDFAAITPWLGMAGR